MLYPLSYGGTGAQHVERSDDARTTSDASGPGSR